MPDPDYRQCAATTREGRPCYRKARYGDQYDMLRRRKAVEEPETEKRGR